MNIRKRPAVFFIGFAVVALLLAGVVSYFADSSPDGLDATIQRGCDTGDCIANNAREHDLASGPLADYALGGDGGFTGVAGVIGVLITLAVVFGLFTLLRKPSRKT